MLVISVSPGLGANAGALRKNHGVAPFHLGRRATPGGGPIVARPASCLLYPPVMSNPSPDPRPGFSIRPAAPEDCHATPQALRVQLFERQPPAAACLLAERGPEPLGFALFFPSFSTWECAPGIFLEDLFVRPQHRGQGVGKALFQRVAMLARERGAARLEWAVLDWNQPALDFYKAQGAKALDGWTTHRLDSEALAALASSPGR